jgi:hypothetical protein
MSFYTDASLVLIPSGYKTSKVYSAKPVDGSGDLTFSRTADTATRVGSDGLIEKVRTNELTYSQDFTNAAWGLNNVSVTGGQTDPNGGTTASLAQTTIAISPFFYQTHSAPKAFSIYAKAGTRSNFSIINGVYNNGASFNLSTQTVTNAGAGSLAKIEDVGGGWFRCSVYLSSGADMLVMLADISGGGAVVGDNLYFAFAQLETGDIATDYIATTTAAVSVGPVANLPRLDYSGGASCPSLLLEPERTNLALQSDSVTTSTTNVGYTATSNAATSPDGYASADQILEDTSTLHLVQKEFSVGSTTDTYAVSFFVKANGRTSGRIVYGLSAVPYSSVSADFNLTAGTITAADASAGATAGTSKIENYGNDWYRVSVTGVVGTAGTHYVRLQDTNGGVAGDVTKGFFVWGFQAELGIYSTSMVPTLGAVLTRGQESSSKTSASALIGQTEGTLYSEFVVNGFADYGTPLCINNGSTTESIWLTTFANGDIRAEVYSNAGGGVQASFTKSGNVVGQTYKIAIGYAVNNFAFFVNGVQVGID